MAVFDHGHADVFVAGIEVTYESSGGAFQLSIGKARGMADMIFGKAIFIKRHAVGRPADKSRKQKEGQAENKEPSGDHC